MTTRVNWNEPYDFLITRASIFGNPYSHKDGTLAEFKTSSKRESIEKFREHFNSNTELQQACRILKDKRIACVCPKGQSCHGDVYVDFLNKDDKLTSLFYE
jgi:hypothetical protein